MSQQNHDHCVQTANHYRFPTCEFKGTRKRREKVTRMKNVIIAADGDGYVTALDGWRRDSVEALRNAVRAAAKLEERIKWGHLVYFNNGPVLFIRAEEQRVLFGFWRGQRLLKIEPRLKPGGKYEMATLELREGDVLDSKVVRKLSREAVALNQEFGDPTVLAKK